MGGPTSGRPCAHRPLFPPAYQKKQAGRLFYIQSEQQRSLIRSFFAFYVFLVDNYMFRNYSPQGPNSG